MLPVRCARKAAGKGGKRRALQLVEVVGLADRARSRPDELDKAPPPGKLLRCLIPLGA